VQCQVCVRCGWSANGLSFSSAIYRFSLMSVSVSGVLGLSFQYNYFENNVISAYLISISTYLMCMKTFHSNWSEESKGTHIVCNLRAGKLKDRSKF